MTKFGDICKRGSTSLTFLLLLSCRDHFKHELRAGKLSEVATTTIRIYFVDDTPKLAIGNEATDGACLELKGLSATVNGVAQTFEFAGGRTSGQAKASWSPVNRTDLCDAARATVRVPDDPSRTADLIEIRDGAVTLRAEFPNVLAKTVFLGSGPFAGRPGEALTLRLQPEPVRGDAATDPANFLVGFLGGKIDTRLDARLSASGDVEVALPPNASPGVTTLRLISLQNSIRSKSCTASSCLAASRVVAEGRIIIAP